MAWLLSSCSTTRREGGRPNSGFREDGGGGTQRKGGCYGDVRIN